MRFCQQCGRFHPIDEFDGLKKTCQRRLDLHNAQRRRNRELGPTHRRKFSSAASQRAQQGKRRRNASPPPTSQTFHRDDEMNNEDTFMQPEAKNGQVVATRPTITTGTTYQPAIRSDPGVAIKPTIAVKIEPINGVSVLPIVSGDLGGDDFVDDAIIDRLLDLVDDSRNNSFEFASLPSVTTLNNRNNPSSPHLTSMRDMPRAEKPALRLPPGGSKQFVHVSSGPISRTDPLVQTPAAGLGFPLPLPLPSRVPPQVAQILSIPDIHNASLALFDTQFDELPSDMRNALLALGQSQGK